MDTKESTPGLVPYGGLSIMALPLGVLIWQKDYIKHDSIKAEYHFWFALLKLV